MRGLWVLVALGLGLGCAPVEPEPAQVVAPVTVRWRAWGEEAFAEAARTNKPILVYVEAGWCHWCHVMEERTLEDPEVAAWIAERYVAIRVDSDRRPDVRERYKRWGWPATALLTATGEPILNRRGYVKSEVYRRLLVEVAEAHATGGAYPEATPERAEGTSVGLEEARVAARAQLDGVYDEEAGGWGTFWQRLPTWDALEHALWRSYAGRAPVWEARARETLEVQAALIDPVWGGMYQYSDSGVWDSPHYERIVKTQAGGLIAYGEGVRRFGDTPSRGRGEAIRDYVARFLTAPSGAFYASQDADPPPSARLSAPDYYALGDAERVALGVPRVDERVYADLNGRLIEGLARWAAATGDRVAESMAVRAAEALLETHVEGGEVRHEAGGEAAYVADHVDVGRGWVALYHLTGEPVWLARAEAVAERVLGAFRDDEGALLGRTEEPGVPLRPRQVFLEAARCARWWVWLHGLTEREVYREAAEGLLEVAGRPAEVGRWGRLVGECVLGLELLARPPVVVTVRGPAGEAREALRRAVLRGSAPEVWVGVGEGEEVVADVCGGGACWASVRGAEEVEEAVRSLIEGGS